MASRFRTGLAAILAGALYFAGQGGEVVFGENVPGAVYVILGIGGFVALAVALWGLRNVLAGSRLGRIGMRTALVGVGVLLLFAVQLAIELIRTGDIPDNFVLFLIGFLLILVGQLLFARDLGPSWDGPGCSRSWPSSASCWRSSSTRWASTTSGCSCSKARGSRSAWR